jgi:PAS domain S-box-containing protein
MRIGHELLATPLLCLYQADPQYPQLHKSAAWEPSESPFFPEILPSTDLIRSEAPSLWLPGKKVTSELHRTARIANLAYMATCPLGQKGAWSGLLATGDLQGIPPENLLPLLSILSAYLQSAIEHFILVNNLSQDVKSHTHAYTVHSAIAENAQEGIILLNPDLTILEMNQAAELILGYASQEVIGTSAENILIGADTVPAALKSAQQGIPTHNLGNISLHRRRGQSFAAHVQTIPVFSGIELESIVVFLSDESEYEQIRVRTQQLEQRAVLGEVTAIFAHEVRNPINNISTGLQLMAMNLPPEDANQEAIARMQHDCNRLTHLMESVLSFSRPQEYKFEPTDLGLLLKRILERWEPRMARAGVKSLFMPSSSTPQVSGDPRALEQVFTNLISNAVQAMSKTGGSLAIKIEGTRPPGEHPQVVTSVTDSGPGIPDEIRDHIFEPFVTTNPQGTGLGLAITKRIITAHKGIITVTSFPGGTMFQVSLPAIIGEAK